MSPHKLTKPEQAAVGGGRARIVGKALLVGAGLLSAGAARTAPATDASRPDIATFLRIGDSTRGVRVRPLTAGSGGLTIVPVEEPPAQGVSPTVRLETVRPAQSPGAAPDRLLRQFAAEPIRIAALDGETAWFPALQRLRPVVLVDAAATPDLTWDPKSREVLAGRDVVARDISAADLPGVVDQALAIAWFKRVNPRAVQPIKLLSPEELHTRGARIDVRIEQLTGRYLVLFDLSGTGAAQLLYPLGADPAQRADAAYTVTFRVREPFGADYVVAVTADKEMAELERTLRESARHIDLPALASALDGLDARIGYVRIFSSP